MSEAVTLGDADAAPRWIGIRRHHVVLVLVGVTFLADAVLRVGSSYSEVVVGVLCVVATVPGRDGLSTGEWLSVGARFLLRPRFSVIEVEHHAATSSSRDRPAAPWRLFVLEHRGRLDLSGADGVVATALTDTVDGLATGTGARHVSVHLARRGQSVAAMLALPAPGRPPTGWAPHGPDHDPAWTPPQWCLERWGYLRTAQGVLTVLRVATFGPPTRSLLEALQHSAAWSELALHVEIVAGPQAHRIVARAVHAARSDAAATSSVGFRRTARSTRRGERTAQREEMVARGRALVRLGAYVVVTAPDVTQLRRLSAELRDGAQAGGIRCERGGGRQLTWWTAHQPGGVGW